ncbi:MAG: hypothetical protein ABW321_15670, partial [Polyangiales bacterium]
MSSRTAHACSIALCALALPLVLTTQALAQEPEEDAAVTATARALAIDGVKLAQSDQCREAIDKLERAEKLHHAPVVLTRLGECYIKLGRIVAGVESLRAVLREPIPANATAAVTQAYADAQRGLDGAKPQLASLTILVSGVDDLSQLGLSIDGRALPSALLGAAQPSDPGEHTIHVNAEGFLSAARTLTLAPGEEQTVTLTLSADPKARAHSEANLSPAAATSNQVATAAPPSATAPATESGSASHWPAYVSWGVGTVALGVGIGFGVAAMSDKAELDRRCPQPSMCSPDAAGLIDDSRTRANI